MVFTGQTALQVWFGFCWARVIFRFVGVCGRYSVGVFGRRTKWHIEASCRSLKTRSSSSLKVFEVESWKFLKLTCNLICHVTRHDKSHGLEVVNLVLRTLYHRNLHIFNNLCYELKFQIEQIDIETLSNQIWPTKIRDYLRFRFGSN